VIIRKNVECSHGESAAFPGRKVLRRQVPYPGRQFSHLDVLQARQTAFRPYVRLRNGEDENRPTSKAGKEGRQPFED
jgi:hypothetical protein